ncbi:MAG: aspartate carbamoyltransferase catalytic subunit [Legionellales bacterium]|nr:aspartate carbamoyltransferase catalytic subunit [Legionellales bacterium]
MEGVYFTLINLILPNMIQHLLQISDLDRTHLENLLTAAQRIAQQPARSLAQRLLDHTLVNLFYENSTRTRVSFELAAKRLGAHVINVDVKTSSVQKGESLLDSILTLQAMGCDFLVMRHPQEDIGTSLIPHLHPTLHLINAGDGCHAHPTQALLDMFTLLQHGVDFTKLSVAIVGDTLHSRVTNSQLAAFDLLGTRDIRIIGPAELLPTDLPFSYVKTSTDLVNGLQGVDVIMLLRIQRERMPSIMLPDAGDYFAHYGLTQKRLALANPKAVIMHPGPVNVNVEIAETLVYHAQSTVLQQVTNGVLLRTALLDQWAKNK